MHSPAFLHREPLAVIKDMASRFQPLAGAVYPRASVPISRVLCMCARMYVYRYVWVSGCVRVHVRARVHVWVQCLCSTSWSAQFRAYPCSSI
jgi:hypothetical protein